MIKKILRLTAILTIGTTYLWWKGEGANLGWSKIPEPNTAGVTRFVPGVDVFTAGAGLSFVFFAISFMPRLNKPKQRKIRS